MGLSLNISCNKTICDIENNSCFTGKKSCIDVQIFLNFMLLEANKSLLFKSNTSVSKKGLFVKDIIQIVLSRHEYWSSHEYKVRNISICFVSFLIDFSLKDFYDSIKRRRCVIKVNMHCMVCLKYHLIFCFGEIVLAHVIFCLFRKNCVFYKWIFHMNNLQMAI